MLKKLINKYVNKETISYVFFGALTTFVNLGAYWICTHVGIDYRISNTIAWVLAVAFAYVTNKLFVFESKSWKGSVVIKEVIGFVGARLLSFVFETGFLIFTVEILKMNDFIAKCVASIFVLIMNYVASKFFIFKK